MRSKSHHQTNGVLFKPPGRSSLSRETRDFFSENGELSTVSTCLRPLLIEATTTTDRGCDHYWSESGAVVIEGIEEYCPARPPIIVRMRLSARVSSPAV